MMPGREVSDLSPLTWCCVIGVVIVLFVLLVGTDQIGLTLRHGMLWSPNGSVKP